jgi:hypothetical protein
VKEATLELTKEAFNKWKRKEIVIDYWWYYCYCNILLLRWIQLVVIFI